MNWGSFVDVKDRANVTMACEFLANWPERKHGLVKVRNKEVPTTIDAINTLYEFPDLTRDEHRLRVIKEDEHLDLVDVAETVGFLGLRKHFSYVQMDRLKYVYAIMKGYKINVGQVNRGSFELMVQSALGGGLGLAGIITDLCQASEVNELPFDNKVVPQRKMDVSMVNMLKEPHPYGQPLPKAQPQGRRRPGEQSAKEEENVPQQLPGPIDLAMQYTHAQLNYIIQQNNHMQNYMVQRSIYDESQVTQLNSLITRMNIGIEDPNYLAPPPQFHPYDHPPPPNPF
uniref:Putative plant transposon protein domain-containing protein n=1 Tax=Cannabis sativa TaxID=3483 RepID=A0A803P9X8_CANSA